MKKDFDIEICIREKQIQDIKNKHCFIMDENDGKVKELKEINVYFLLILKI